MLTFVDVKLHASDDWMHYFREMSKPYVCSLPPEVQEMALKELGEDEFRRTQSLDAIRQWIKKQPHLQNFPIRNFFLYIRNRLYYGLIHPESVLLLTLYNRN